MSKAHEITEMWKEIRPQMGKMINLAHQIETNADKEYQRGLDDAWEAARKIASDNAGRNYSIFGQHFTVEILNTHSASEAIEEIRAYEQAQKEKEEEKSISAEDVMRQYLNEFCKGHRCTDKECALHTHDFTCGRGYHFLTSCVSDEEVRRAYAKVLQKDEGKS